MAKAKMVMGLRVKSLVERVVLDDEETIQVIPMDMTGTLKGILPPCNKRSEHTFLVQWDYHVIGDSKKQKEGDSYNVVAADFEDSEVPLDSVKFLVAELRELPKRGRR